MQLVDGRVDGLPTTASTAPPATPAEHPNGSLYIDHVVLFSPDLPRTMEALSSIGLTPLRERETGTYGAPMRQVFYRLGEVIGELIGPAEPAEGDAGFFGLAMTVRDLDAAHELLGEHLGDAKDAVQEGRRIATLRHKELGISVATALMTPEP